MRALTASSPEEALDWMKCLQEGSIFWRSYARFLQFLKQEASRLCQRRNSSSSVEEESKGHWTVKAIEEGEMERPYMEHILKNVGSLESTKLWFFEKKEGENPLITSYIIFSYVAHYYYFFKKKTIIKISSQH